MHTQTCEYLRRQQNPTGKFDATHKTEEEVTFLLFRLLISDVRK